MSHDKIHRNILENLSDGVMTIGQDGTVITFNVAAEKILGFRAVDVVGRPYGEVFFLTEGNDEFNQAILNAVYDSAMLHYDIIAYQRGDMALTLAVTTSLLTLEERGHEKKAAVIVVFDDISEVEKLRQSEKTLVDELKEKHRELVSAYMNLENANKDLKVALKKVQMIRIMAGGFVFLLFITLGFITWKRSVPSGPAPRAGTAAKGDKSAVRTLTVSKQTLTDRITLKGALKPVKVINIISPFTGKVKEIFIQYGQAVTKGQILVRLDTAELEVKHRDARVAYIEALEVMKKYRDWVNSDEVMKMKRSLTKSLMSLESAKNKFENSETLYNKGIISKIEYNGDKQSYETAKMDYDTALSEQKATLIKGTGDHFETIRLKLANAEHKLKEIEQELRQASIYAPVSGTVILPDLAAAQDRKAKTIEKGVSFSQGDILVTIGDTEGLSISATVDEMEVIKISRGQEARIMVDAYPDIALKGAVAHVSTQASKGDSARKGSSFEIMVTSEKPDEEARQKLRLGMSATVDILILNRPDAILIPIGAVGAEGADRVVTVQDKNTKELKKVRVETGITTLDMVEIVKGLQAGDAVVVP